MPATRGAQTTAKDAALERQTRCGGVLQELDEVQSEAKPTVLDGEAPSSSGLLLTQTSVLARGGRRRMASTQPLFKIRSRKQVLISVSDSSYLCSEMSLWVLCSCASDLLVRVEATVGASRLSVVS